MTDRPLLAVLAGAAANKAAGRGTGGSLPHGLEWGSNRMTDWTPHQRAQIGPHEKNQNLSLVEPRTSTHWSYMSTRQFLISSRPKLSAGNQI